MYQKFVFITLLAIQFLCLPYAFTQTPTFLKQFTLNQPGKLEVNTAGGDILIEGSTGNEVEIEVFVEKEGQVLKASDDLLPKFNKYYGLEIKQNDNQVIVAAKRLGKPNKWHYVFGVTFKIKAPVDMANSLNAYSGNIKVKNQKGSQKLTTSLGDVYLQNIVGEVYVSATSSIVQIDQQEGNVLLRTSGGNLDINESKGNIDVISSGGDLHIQDSEGDIVIKSSGGNVMIVNSSAELVEVINSGGKIELDLENLSQKLKLNTSGGDINAFIKPAIGGLSLDLKAEEIIFDLPEVFSGIAKSKSVYGTISEGGALVKMNATGGHINLDIQQPN